MSANKYSLEIDRFPYEKFVEFSDITFVVAGSKINANKCVLCTYSDYFKGLIVNSNSDSIKIESMCHNALYYIIRLIYGKMNEKKSMDEVEEIVLDEEEFFQVVKRLHEFLELDLFESVLEEYCKNAFSIKNLCHLRFLTDKLDLIRDRLKFLYSEDIENTSLIKENLDEDEFKFVLGLFPLEKVINFYGSEVIKSISLEYLRSEDLIDFSEEISDFLGGEAVLKEISMREQPEINLLDKKILISYPIFRRVISSVPNVVKIRLPLSDGVRFYKKDGKVLTPYTFDRYNNKIRVDHNRKYEIKVKTKEGVVLKEDDLLKLYYVPEDIDIINFNLFKK